MIFRKVKMIAIFVCFALIVLFAAVGVNAYLTYRQALEQKDLKATELAEVKTQIRDLKETFELFEKERKEFEGMLFSEKDVPAFLDGISKFAEKSNVNVIDMKTMRFQEVRYPGDEEDVRALHSRLRKAQKVSTEKVPTAAEVKAKVEKIFTLAAMPISFQVQGTYADFIKFLGHLEDFQQLLTISNVEIGTTRDYPVLKCAFTLKIYSFKTLEELEL